VGVGVFPPLRSLDAVPTNLPIVRTELTGRTNDVAALADLVERKRLVTLTGVGGVGKTRLALAVAASVGSGFADGCWLVGLATVSGGSEVAKAVSIAMRSPTVDALVAYLVDRRMLIVLDNCEHVLSLNGSSGQTFTPGASSYAIELSVVAPYNSVTSWPWRARSIQTSLTTFSIRRGCSPP
jgi:hypothetical protein